jgi:site-specific recombinase XerD
MFHQLFERPQALKRQLSAPFASERRRYLDDRAKQGAVLRTLREIAIYLLIVIEFLRLRKKRPVSYREIEAAAARWARCQSEVYGRQEPLRSLSKARFRRHARRWLSFLGWLEIPPPAPVAPEVAAFVDFLRTERGLCEETIEGRRHNVEWFLAQMKDLGYRLDRLTLTEVDAVLLRKYGSGKYAPRTIQTQASGLRAFFRYAESRHWCRPGISQGIQSPRVYRHASLPSSPSWQDVQRLLKTTVGHRPTDIRDRAILLLLVVYGLRAGEVRRLRLADLDWERETLTITHGKSGRRQVFPLNRIVGQAILRYLQKARPRSAHREVFLCMRAPIRPLKKSGVLFQLVNRRMKALDIPIVHHGPHALRHACATRLINQGLSLKAIADQLGHQSLETTRIYAKVDLSRLREVARLNLGGLL